MSKRLIILRHSKTEKVNPAGDKARELTKPGHRYAIESGRDIRQAAGMPDLFVSSDAIRAVQTANLAAEAMQFEGEHHILPGIYGATPEQLETVVQALPDEHDTIVLVGHNPGLEELANGFRGKSADEHLPTAGWVVVDTGSDRWATVKAGAGKVVASGKPDKG